jgi:hypothetical protein
VIHVRRHTRELPSGKTTTVRQHERSGSPARDAAPHDDDSWWDGSRDERPAGSFPDGTSFFRDGDDVYAAHPDGTVHPVAPAGRDARRPASEPDHYPCAGCGGSGLCRMAPTALCSRCGGSGKDPYALL